MFPILLQIDPLVFYSLWVAITIGLFLGFLVVIKLTPLRKNKLTIISENSLLLFFSSLILSRLFFVVSHFNYYLFDWNEEGNFVVGQIHEAFFLWDKGLSGWGAIVGFLIALYWVCKQYRDNFMVWMDIFSPALILIIAFSNFGAFLDGRNYGTPTDLPWGISLLNSQFAVPIHPVQAYATIYSLLIFAFLIFIFQKTKKAGNITWIAVGSYGFFRFLEEFIRGDETWLLMDIRVGQIIALSLTILAAYQLFGHHLSNLKKVQTK